MTVTTEEFSNPGSSDKFEAAELKGSLLLITPTELRAGENQVRTQNFGMKDAVVADVVVLDGDQKDTVLQNTMLFGGVLIGQTKNMIGKRVLGRLTQGTAKPGQQPPWRLDDPTEADKVIATDYIRANASDPFGG